MNFVTHQKKIQTLLNTRSGLYVFSRDKSDKTFKLGMSEANLFKRLRQHKSCYPYKSEYWLQMIILTDNTHTRVLEKTLLAATKARHTLTVEGDDKKEDGNRPREYRVFGTRTQLNTVIRGVLNDRKNREQWSHCIVFSENSWIILKNIALTHAVSNPIDTVNTLAQKSSRIMTTPPIEKVKALPYQISEIEIKGELKVGKKITTKWGKMKITKIISKNKIQGKWDDYDGEFVLKI